MDPFAYPSIIFDHSEEIRALDHEGAEIFVDEALEATEVRFALLCAVRNGNDLHLVRIEGETLVVLTYPGGAAVSRGRPFSEWMAESTARERESHR